MSSTDRNYTDRDHTDSTSSDRLQTNAQKVHAFHTAIHAGFPSVPTVPARSALALHLSMLREEMAEVEAEVGHLATLEQPGVRDLAPLAHELADLLYVTYSALGSLGMDPDAVFAEVHRANLSKTAGPRRADGKQLKPDGWTKADVLRVIAGGDLD